MATGALHQPVHGGFWGAYSPNSSGSFKRRGNSRQRMFSPLVTFWAFLAQVLERGSSCRDALQRLSAWWQVQFPRLGSPSADTSAYCQARGRLDETVLQQIGSEVAKQLERRVTNHQLWLGRRVKIVDGTGLSMPDTAANQRQWPQSSGQRPGFGFFPCSKSSAFSVCIAERFCRWSTMTFTIMRSRLRADFYCFEMFATAAGWPRLRINWLFDVLPGSTQGCPATGLTAGRRIFQSAKGETIGSG